MLNAAPGSRTLQRGLLLLALLMALSMAWRIAAPSDIDDNEQPITIAQFFDVARQGHWLIQFNPFEGLSTKPPAYHWMGGVILLITGLISEWGLKLASILSWIITAALVVIVARLTLPWRMALLAGGFWVANFHTLKLGYTARPDMALAMCMTLALLGVLLQKPPVALAWNPQAPRRYWFCWALVWGTTLLAGLVKGPPALLVSIWIPVFWFHQRQWRIRDSRAWALGLVVVASLLGLWVGLTIMQYPQWHQVLDAELWDRLAGEDNDTKTYPPRWRQITYFIGRFLPWSVLAVGAMILLPWWRRPKAKRDHALQAGGLTHRTRWAAWWVLVVLVGLAIPADRRADHILPAYAGASVLAAAMIELAHRQHRAARVIVEITLWATMVVSLLYILLACFWLPWPGALDWPVALVQAMEPVLLTKWIVLSAGLVAGVSVTIGGLALVRRRHYPAAWSAVFAMASTMGVFNAISSRAALEQEGEYVKAFALTALNQCDVEARQPLFFQTGYVPVQSLMGHHQPMLTYEPASGRVMLITSDAGWARLQEAGATGMVLLQTPTLRESRRALLLVRPEVLPDALGE